ncbi:unnamed protein product, partial [marine sediment metagenome]
MKRRKNPNKLRELAESLVAFAKVNGADEMEISVSDG